MSTASSKSSILNATPGGLGSAAKSRAFAVMLTLGTATALTAAHSIALPSPAEAGVISSIKGAAKKVGGAAKSVGGGAHKAVKRGAVAAAHQAARLPPMTKFPVVRGAIKGVEAVRRHF